MAVCVLLLADLPSIAIYQHLLQSSTTATPRRCMTCRRASSRGQFFQCRVSRVNADRRCTNCNYNGRVCDFPGSPPLHHASFANTRSSLNRSRSSSPPMVQLHQQLSGYSNAPIHPVWVRSTISAVKRETISEHLICHNSARDWIELSGCLPALRRKSWKLHVRNIKAILAEEMLKSSCPKLEDGSTDKPFPLALLATRGMLEEG
ncbi:hypothetical protein V8F20_003625 [Naviculisporaceae sp. PSN 640]